MLKRLILAAMVWMCVSTVAEARERLFGYCMRGGYQVTTQGLKSTEYFQRSFRSCTIHVYFAGTTTLVPAGSIFSDNLTPTSTPLANPFTSASDGYWEFYVPAGRYDVQFTDLATSIQFTWGDLLACDPLGPNEDTSCTALAVPHDLLSLTHPDTVPYSPPEIGDLIHGNLFQKWERHPIAQIGEVLSIIDVGGGQPIDEWVWPSTLDTCTSIQVDGVESGCEHEINFTGGNVTVVATDDSANDRTNVAITAAGGCTDLTQVTNLYVSTAGNDSTGDGTSGSPWLTIQHAIDAGIPGIVCGRYIIHMAVAGTYTGNVRLDGRIFAGGGGFADDQVDWPIVDTSTTPNNYSWVTIEGDTSVAETYIISGMVSVAGGNLTLKGLEVLGASFGVHAAKGAFVNLAAVILKNNYVGAMGTEQSVIRVDHNYYVDDAGFYNLLITVDGFTATDAIEMADGSLLTDYDSGGNNTNTGAIIQYTKGTGTLALACIELKYAQVYFRGTINCEVSGITALSSKVAIQYYNFDGLAPGTGTAIRLDDSVMSGGVFGGGVYNIANANVGVRITGASSLSPSPSTNSATTPYIGSGGDTVPANTRSRDTFMSTALLIDTVQFSTTPAFNMNENGAIKKITLTDNVTSSTITNQRPGEEVTFIICQGGAAKTFAWPANVLGADAIGSSINKCNVQKFVYDQGQASWLAVSPMVKDQ